MVEIGFINDKWETRHRPAYIYTYQKIMEAIQNCGFDVTHVTDISTIDDYDIIFLPQGWTEGPIGVYEDWVADEFEIGPPVVSWIADPRKMYTGPQQRGMKKHASAFFVPCNYLKPFEKINKPAFYVPFGTWEDEDWSISEKDDTIRAPIGYVESDAFRFQAVEKCPMDIDLYGVTKWDNEEYEDEDIPDNINYEGYFVGNDIYRKSKFIFESMSYHWLVPKQNPTERWGDRICFASSHGAMTITNSEFELSKWDSTIDYQTAYETWEEYGTLEPLYDPEATKRDVKKHLYEKHVGPAMTETVDVLT